MTKLKALLPWVLVLAVLVLFRVSTSEGAFNTWNTTFEGEPGGSDPVSSGDDEIRDLKETARNYGEVELCWGDADVDGCSTGNSGRLREGACRAFAEDAAPSAIHAADVPTFGSTALDEGRLWVDTNTTPDNHLQVYHGGAFVDVDAVPAADRTPLNILRDEHLIAARATRSTGLDLNTTAGAITDNCASSLLVIPWNSESFDDATIHDNATEPGRLTSPATASRVRLFANLVISGASDLDFMTAYYVRKNTTSGTECSTGTVVDAVGEFFGYGTTASKPDNIRPNANIATGPIAVTGGDHFVICANVCDTNAAVVNLDNTYSSFSMEVIQ